MKKRTVMSQVGSGFLLTGKVLLMMGWLGLVLGGLIEAFARPEAFNAGPPHRAIGWALLALAGAAFFLTMDRWVKVFPGLVALAALNGIIVIGSGHALNNPQVLIPRLDGAIMTLALGASALLSARFKTQRLTIADRVALFVFVCCVFWSGVAPGLWLAAAIGMVASLVLAWAYDAFRPGGPARRPPPNATIEG